MREPLLELKCIVLGEEVEWVQCDKCENWYHVICVGISSEEATTADEYICPDCKPAPAKKKIKLEETVELGICSSSPQVSDLSVMAQVATQMITIESDVKPELKTEMNDENHNKKIVENGNRQLDLNSLICLADISQKMDTAHVQNNLLNQNEKKLLPALMDLDTSTCSINSVNKELCDPVVPTDGGQEYLPCNV